MSKKIRNIIIIALLVGITTTIIVFDIEEAIIMHILHECRVYLIGLRDSNYALTIAIMMAFYIGAVTLSLPVSLYLTILMGFLFDSILGTFLTVVSATIGATILFLLARSVLHDMFKHKFGSFLEKMDKGFSDNAFSYMMMLRLIPAFPFFVVNIVPAFSHIKLSTYVITTFLGIIPGTFVYVQLGAGLESIIPKDKTSNFVVSDLITLDIIIALVGLTILSFSPMVNKYYMKGNAKHV